MAVLKDPAHIASIKEPAEKVQLAAVQKNPEYIRHIESPTVKVQHMAIQGNADTLRHIKSPADTVQLAAVKPKEKPSGMCPNPRRWYNWLPSEAIH